MKKTQFIPLLLLFGLFLLSLNACKYREETISRDSGLKLSFSQDSVLFDTVFTDLKTVTKTFRVYNPHPNALEISVVNLGAGSGSSYQIWVNGQDAGDNRQVNDILIRGKDSIRVLVEAKVDGRNLNNPFLIRDSIVFLTNGNYQNVILQAYGRDAYYYRDATVCDTTWSNDKPHIIMDQLVVDSNCTLTIQAGTEVYMQDFYIPQTYIGANLIVKGALNCLGTKTRPVTFQGIRKEERFDDQPGQWGSIIFYPSAKASNISFTLIKEGYRGIQLGFPDLNYRDDFNYANVVIQRSEIRAMQDVGILAFDANLWMFNSIVSDCGQRNLSIQKGGNYVLFNNLFAYSDNLNFSKRPSSVYISDAYFQGNTFAGNEELNILFHSNIVEGPNDNEFFLFPFDPDTFKTSIGYNLLKYDTNNPQNPNLDTTNLLFPILYKELGKDKDETFRLNRMAFEKKREYDFQPKDTLLYQSTTPNGSRFYDTLSLPHINIGDQAPFTNPNLRTIGLELLYDKNNTSRDISGRPDAGPYESNTED